MKYGKVMIMSVMHRHTMPHQMPPGCNTVPQCNVFRLNKQKARCCQFAPKHPFGRKLHTVAHSFKLPDTYLYMLSVPSINSLYKRISTSEIMNKDILPQRSYCTVHRPSY